MEIFNRETGHAIYRAAKLDYQLQQLLLHALARMTNKLAKRLFDNNGPLGTFSAKIDFARVLDLIDAQTYRNLHAIRGMRNVFAHAEEPVRFKSPEVVAKARKFPQWRDGASARTLFDNAVNEAEVVIAARMNALIYAETKRKDAKDTK